MPGVETRGPILCDSYTLSCPKQTFLSTSKVPGLVVVRAEFLDFVSKMSVEMYDLAGKLDLFATREAALKLNEEVMFLKSALEVKEEGE